MANDKARQEIVEQLKDHEFPEPEPLTREPPSESKFPTDALLGLEAMALAIHNDFVQCPIVLGAHSLLAASSLVAQQLFNIEVPYSTGNQIKPPSLNLITVAVSGERKTTADNIAKWPITFYEESAQQHYRTRTLPDFQRDHTLWQFGKQQAKGDKAALRDLGPEPAKPRLPIMLWDDATYEGLCKFYAAGYRSCGLFATEGGQFIGGYSMAKDNKVRTAGGLSNLFDGEPIRRLRASDQTEATTISGCRLSVHLMAQPDIAKSLYSDRALINQGILSRMLLAWPKSTIGTRFSREPTPKSIKAMDTYNGVMAEILERVGKNKPLFKLRLTSKAKRLWLAYHDDHEERLRKELAEISEFVNKIPEQVIRLASILWLMTVTEHNSINSYELEAAIDLGEYYINEIQRMYATGYSDPKIELARDVSFWLKEHWMKTSTIITLRDVYQRGGPRAVRNKAKAGEIVSILEHHKHLVRVGEIDSWCINPKL